MWRLAIPALSKTPDKPVEQGFLSAEGFAGEELGFVLLNHMRRNRRGKRE